MYDPFGHPSLSFTPRSMLNAMHHLERETDRLMSTLLEDDYDVHSGQNVSEASDPIASHLATKTSAFNLKLRPSFSIEDNHNVFVLTAVTPGLSKEDLVVDVRATLNGLRCIPNKNGLHSTTLGQQRGP